MEYQIIQIESSFLSTNCYLIKYDDKYVLVDPCIDVDNLISMGVENLIAILITHGHVDHILTLKSIVDYYQTKVYCTKQCIDKIYNDDYNLSNMFNPLNIQKNSFEYEEIEDNQIILENLNIKCITTPGHSSCSVCYLLNNDLFTGDTLFDGSVGRTDLFSGNSVELKRSLMKILDFKTNYNIYPGHGPISNINKQIEKNYYLKF